MPSANCDLQASFGLVAEERLKVRASGGAASVGARTTTVLINGQTVTEERVLDAGTDAQVEIRSQRKLTVRPYQGSALRILFPPSELRHLLLGQYESLRFSDNTIHVPLLKAGHVAFDGPIRVRVTAPISVTVQVGSQEVRGDAEVVAGLETIELSIAAPAEIPPPTIAHGGPVLAAGARAPLGAANEERFLLRGAYEMAAFDYTFAAISFESDFESIMQSLVIEAATPGVLYVIPSFTAGVGFVARQLGPRDADAALRLRLGGNYQVIGGGMDLDYWPAIEAWTGSATIRLSL
ncbi:MAG: hypothetical protein DRI90_12605 [Deltaproteobacteria bacterium]|nr:MAG: hypothetical protein DRI90_12605 [Deltaproteobacteria bacterium]